ncbi:MAG: ferredoxin [Alteromonadaceae bacterium]|nr:ferredoxin [Alteromonadaceae bacterium]MBB19369.1 ferredoxin [Rickettsiales bacterium]
MCKKVTVVEHDPDAPREQTISFAHNNLLDCLLTHNIPKEYHCKEGFCGACRTQLIEGEVEYLLDPLAFIDDGEILACCCKPLGHIKIKA